MKIYRPENTPKTAFEPQITVTDLAGEKNTYTYIWGDEFDGDKLDSTKWVATYKETRMGIFSDLALSEEEDVIYLKDGNLCMPAIYSEEKGYVSPVTVHTYGKVEYRYGYLEIRARVPYKLCAWPSYWLTSGRGQDMKNKYSATGERKNFNYGVEVDVFEVFGSTDLAVPNIHRWYADGRHEMAKSEAKTLYSCKEHGKDTDAFHTYGLEWTPEKISMYVDGVCYNTFDITDAKKSFGEDIEDLDMSGFHDPLHIMFNNHLFTKGSTEANYNFSPGKEVIQDFHNDLPYEYEIEYIRLYQNPDMAKDDTLKTQLWIEE